MSCGVQNGARIAPFVDFNRISNVNRTLQVNYVYDKICRCTSLKCSVIDANGFAQVMNHN